VTAAVLSQNSAFALVIAEIGVEAQTSGSINARPRFWAVDGQAGSYRFVRRIGPEKRASSDGPIAGRKADFSVPIRTTSSKPVSGPHASSPSRRTIGADSDGVPGSSAKIGNNAYLHQNIAFNGAFTPVLAKHSKSFSLVDFLAIGVDRMQRNFEPMRKQVEAWQRSELMDVTAKVVICEAFIEGRLEAPKHLARSVHDLYFEPKCEEFRPRTIWSLSNAFTSAFKELDPIPQFKATAKLGEFLEAQFSRSF
jgi:hypothetical protein